MPDLRPYVVCGSSRSHRTRSRLRRAADRAMGQAMDKARRTGAWRGGSPRRA
uniref:hypothetical protein n=1 Tax=Saccharothrix mutabilis TaxID=33921 RepID=UPI0031D32041